MQVNVIQSDNGSKFVLTKIDASGKETVSIENAMHVADNVTIGRGLQNVNKNQANQRAMFQSLLFAIFANPKLDGYRAKGDKTTGKTSKEFKDSIRVAEHAFIEQLVTGGVIKLPASDNQEKALQTFCTSIREDKNYSNIKSTVAKYFAFVGANCATQAGFLVPHAIMLVQISSVMELSSPDNSIAGMLDKVKVEMDKQETISETDVKKALVSARLLLATLEGLNRHYDEIATNAVQHMPVNAGDTPSVASELIGKMQRAPRPEALEIPALM